MLAASSSSSKDPQLGVRLNVRLSKDWNIVYNMNNTVINLLFVNVIANNTLIIIILLVIFTLPENTLIFWQRASDTSLH